MVALVVIEARRCSGPFVAVVAGVFAERAFVQPVFVTRSAHRRGVAVLIVFVASPAVLDARYPSMTCPSISWNGTGTVADLDPLVDRFGVDALLDLAGLWWHWRHWSDENCFLWTWVCWWQPMQSSTVVVFFCLCPWSSSSRAHRSFQTLSASCRGGRPGTIPLRVDQTGQSASLCDRTSARGPTSSIGGTLCSRRFW